MSLVFALVTVVLMAVAAGCSESVPPSTADVDATVEARVGAAREADLATAEAHAEATRAAAPTDTPVPDLHSGSGPRRYPGLHVGSDSRALRGCSWECGAGC